jgi:hypothetical protein
LISNPLSSYLESQRKLYLRAEIAHKVKVINSEGYYLSSNILSSFDLDYINNTLSNWESVDKVDFDAQLRSLIDEHKNWIIQYAIEVLPNRKEIIETIFKLYMDKNHIAVIPLVLSQIDGIAKEMTLGKAGFYNSKSDKLAFQAANPYVHFISNAMQLHYENRNDYELFRKNIVSQQDFNRHAILHGESYQFGTEKNAIKAILLFDFVLEIYSANSY